MIRAVAVGQRKGKTQGGETQSGWVFTSELIDQEHGHHRVQAAGSEREGRAQPPPGRLLPPPHILLGAASVLPDLARNLLQPPPLGLILCLISSRGEELTPSQPITPCAITAALNPPTQTHSPCFLPQSPLPHLGARYIWGLTNDLDRAGDPSWGSVSSLVLPAGPHAPILRSLPVIPPLEPRFFPASRSESIKM